MGQQGLLPKPTDSRLWLLEVRPGQERRLVVSLMAKACKQTLFIKSAFMQDHLAVRLLVNQSVSQSLAGCVRESVRFCLSMTLYPC